MLACCGRAASPRVIHKSGSRACAGLDLDFESLSAEEKPVEPVVGAGPASSPSPAPAAADAGEWEEHVSQNKGGLIYYYNRRTGQTTWHPPQHDPRSLLSAGRRSATPTSQYPAAHPALAEARWQSRPIIHANETPAPRLITLEGASRRQGSSGRSARHADHQQPASARPSATPPALAVDYPRFLSAREARNDWPGLNAVSSREQSAQLEQPRLALYPNGNAAVSKTPRSAGAAG